MTEIIPNQWSDWYTYKSVEVLSLPEISIKKEKVSVTITVKYSKKNHHK